MPGYWILKTEPSTYSFDRLVNERRAVWDGVSNALALKHIRSMAKGDQAFVYHTGDEKALVGLARIVSDPYPDPKGDDPKLAVVDIEAGDPLGPPCDPRHDQGRPRVRGAGAGPDVPPERRARCRRTSGSGCSPMAACAG